MKRAWLIAVLCLGLSACAHAPGPRDSLSPDLELEKRRLMGLLEAPPVSRLELTDLAQTSPKKRKLLELYRDEVWPAENRVKEREIRKGLLEILITRALYVSPEERSAWEGQAAAINQELQGIRSSEAWKALHERFFQLARGLPGELAAHARQAQAALAQERIRPEAAAIQGQLDAVYGRLGRLDRESPFNATYGAAKKASLEVLGRWFAGQLDLESATRELEALQKTGLVASGQDFATRGRDDLNRLAVLRSRLARAQGFRSWAAYQVSKDAAGYAKEYGTPEKRLAFLRAVLRRTDRSYADFLHGRAGQAAVRAAALPLIALETDPLLESWFPLDRAEERWRRMVLGNGFDPHALSEIHLDTRPRPGKHTGGYNNAVIERQPRMLRLDALTLSVAYPPEADPQAWYAAEIDSLSNLTYDGPGPQRTLFHEGGHALDFAFRRNPFQLVPAYGYTETTSMLMELYFFDDPGFLGAAGVPADVIARYRANAEGNRQLERRQLAAEAAVDIEVWDYDFTRAGAEPFVDRALRLYARWMSRATRTSYGTEAGLDWRASAFSQGWLWGGKVRRFSYVLANESARFVAEALRDKLQRATGRRSLYDQPLLAPTLIDGLLRTGFGEEFPRSIERFAGKPFRPL